MGFFVSPIGPVLINHPGDYVEFVSGILCMALEYGKVYTVTATGRRYRLNPKIITVETGSIVRYEVELYHVTRDINPRDVKELVLSGVLLTNKQHAWVELVVKRESKWWSRIDAYPRILFSPEELRELVKALLVDGERCRMGVA